MAGCVASIIGPGGSRASIIASSVADSQVGQRMKDSMEDAKNTSNVGKQKALLQFAKDFDFDWWEVLVLDGWRAGGVTIFSHGVKDFGWLDPFRRYWEHFCEKKKGGEFSTWIPGSLAGMFHDVSG